MTGRDVQLLFDAVVAVGLVWFWFRRARPILLALQAEPLALRLGVAATLLAITAVVAHFLTLLAGASGFVPNVILILGGLIWTVIVGLGYPEYRFLRHATGSKPPGR